MLYFLMGTKIAVIAAASFFLAMVLGGKKDIANSAKRLLKKNPQSCERGFNVYQITCLDIGWLYLFLSDCYFSGFFLGFHLPYLLADLCFLSELLIYNMSCLDWFWL